MSNKTKIRSTTVIAVKKDGKVAMAGDGQVTLGETVCKGNARKVRKIYDGKILTGFAGSVADSFTLLDKIETKVKESEAASNEKYTKDYTAYQTNMQDITNKWTEWRHLEKMRIQNLKIVIPDSLKKIYDIISKA